MKILLLHSDFIEFEPKKKAIKDAEKWEKGKQIIKECLVVFTAVEKADEKNPEQVAKNTVKEIMNVLKQINCKKVVLYPYVHLTSEPSNPKTARKVLSETEKLLKKKKIAASHAPFGYYKAFNIKCKGHPLSELSREITAEGVDTEKEEIDEEEGELEDLLIITTHKKIKKRKDLTKKESEIETAIKIELKEISETSFGEPPHLKLMRKLEIADNEEVSDAGNKRFYPKGALVVELLRELGWKMAINDLNAMPANTPFIINPNHPSVKIMMNKFPERLYKVLPGSKKKKQEFRLRPACDYGIWSIFKDATISYKNLPLGLYEFDVMWRYEQRGELLGLYRIRNSMMPDLHEMCENMDQALERFKAHMEKFAVALYHFLEMKPKVIVLNCKTKFFNKWSNVFKSWASELNIPIIVKLFKSMRTYKVAWIDVVAFDNLGRPMEVSTVQLDTESAEWWGITFKGKDNKDKHPLFLHTGFGIERTIAALLENAYGKKNPILPLWLSPTQVRLCPISDKYLLLAKKFALKIEKEKIRVDIDDRVESVSRKIRDAEVEWVPIIVVLGEREKKTGKLGTRFRETGEVKKMELEKIVKYVKLETKHMPFKSLPLPKLISKRPVFVG